MIDYESLRPYATVRQAQVLDAIKASSTHGQAAKLLGCHRRKISENLERLRKSAAKAGWAPGHGLTNPAAPGFGLTGVSTLYGPDGKINAQWVKQAPDQEAAKEAIRSMLEGMKDEIPRVRPTAGPAVANSALLNCYVITDYHLGMLSWSEETRADWDLKIAEQTLVDWFSAAIAQSPKAETAILAQLSDLLHADSTEPLTPTSKNVLDVDSRFQKVVRVAIRVIRQVIRMLLDKHPKLHIIMADANHDPVAQVWLREWLSVMYEDEPRVTVDTSPSTYNAYEFGKVALFFHHGHRRKVENVSEVFAAQFREMFGRTKYAYAHMGHLHSLHIKENNLMIVEQHRTLAAADAYAARQGWLSGRDAKCITYHREFGEVSRLTINSDMLKDAA